MIRKPKFSPLERDSVVEIGAYKLTLGIAEDREGGMFVREGVAADGVRYRVLEYPEGAAPSRLEKALALDGVAGAIARKIEGGRELIVLRPAPGPGLDWIMRRGEGLPIWGLPLVEATAALLQRVHEAGLCFSWLAPSSLSVAEDGSVHLECPEALVEIGGLLTREVGSVAPPETGEGKASPAADQYVLGVLAWSLMTGRRPPERGGLPSPRVHVPNLPHGVSSVLARATEPDPERRFESVQAFAEAMRRRTAPRGRSATTYRVAAGTEIGRLKKLQMPVNQDAHYYGFDERSLRGMFLVADGVSTADVGSGDLASGFVRDAVKGAWEGPVGDILRSHAGPMPEDWLKAALEAILDDANARIFAYLKQPIFVGSLGPNVHPPCSTAVLAILDGDRLTIANVGDSRVYLLRDGVLEQMTVDQDLRTELLKAGRDPAGIGDPGALGALTQSVGRLSFDDEGAISLRSVKPDIVTVWLRAGDRVLICSDGVPDCMGPDADALMTRELAASDDPEEIVSRLCKLADEMLGGDNITPLVILAN